MEPIESLPQYHQLAGNIDSESSPSVPALGDGPMAPSTADHGTFAVEQTVTSQKRRASRAATTYPRKRATQACETCRFRRTKCDNARPGCAACVRLGADCSYQEADLSSFDPASLAILKRLDDLEGLLAQTRAAEPVVLSAAALPLNQNSPTAPSVHGSSSLGSNVVDVCTPGKPLVNVEAVLQWPPFSEFGFPSCLYPAPRAEDDRQAEENSAWPMSADVDLPSAEGVLRSFFDNVHIFNPILEEEEVRDHIKRVRFEGIGWDAVSCLVLLIYAHGTIATSFTSNTANERGIPTDFRRSPLFRKAEWYFMAAQKRMGMLLCRSRVIDAECFFLAGVYLMTTLRPVEAWKMFVQALACCQGFSINQQHTDSEQFEDESDAKRRIYWTCFKSELELRLELNPSQKDVWDLTYPAFFPSPPEALKMKDETAWYFYLAEIALMRLKNRILRCLYRSDAAASPESRMEYAILDFEEQIEVWLRSLPKQLELGVVHAGNEMQHDVLRFILNGHLFDCQEAMYWQFIVDAVHGRLRQGYYAEQFLRKGLQVCVDRIRQNRKGFSHRHHGTWLMLRSCTRSAFVLLAVVRYPELAVHLPMDWKEAVADVTRMLQLWKDESTDICEMLGILQTLLGTRTSSQSL